MNLLIIGSYSILVRNLIDRCGKENVRVFVLTGSEEKIKKPSGVFEQYRFLPEGDSIREIIESIQPDCVIFTGAYDENYDWKYGRKETIRYFSGLINVLMSCQSLSISQFLYLSSQEVFENNYYQNIMEETEVHLDSYKAMALSIGEELCGNYNGRSGMKTTILRLDHVYGIPKTRGEVNDFFSGMCLEALLDHTVKASDRLHFSGLYVLDAVEAVFRLATAEKTAHFLYHFSSEEEITPKKAAERIQDMSQQETAIEDISIGEDSRCVLSNQRFSREFGVGIHYSFEEGAQRVYSYMYSHLRDYLSKDEKKERSIFTHLPEKYRDLFRALIPFIENIVCFLLVFLANNRTVNSQYFERLDFFLLYVLLFAVIYGKGQSILAAFLSLIAYCWRQLYDFTGFQILVDYNTYVWIAQLFIMGMVVGSLRDRLLVITKDKEDEIQYLTKQLQEVYDINKSNLHIKNIMENRIVNYDDSLGKLYTIVEKLDQTQIGEVIFRATEIIEEIMETKDVAIYQVVNRDYCRLAAASSEQAREFGKSVAFQKDERFLQMLPDLKEDRVFINKNMDFQLPMMAKALKQGEEIQFIIMLWGLKLESLTLYQTNVLTVLSSMLYHSIDKAAQYMDALGNKRLVESTWILEEKNFREVVSCYLDAGIKGLTKYTLLITVFEQEELSELDQKLRKLVRMTDYVGLISKNQIGILLTNSDWSDSQIVIKRLEENGIHTELYEEAGKYE